MIGVYRLLGLLSCLIYKLDVIATPSPTPHPTAIPTHPTPPPSAKPPLPIVATSKNPTPNPTAVPSHLQTAKPTPHPTTNPTPRPTASPSLAHSNPAPNPTPFPTSASELGVPQPTPTAKFTFAGTYRPTSPPTVGPYKVKYAASQRFSAAISSTPMSFAALNKGVVANDGTFFTLLKAALNKALPDIGQAVYPAADNGRYIIDFGAVSSGPVTTYTYGIQTLTLPTLVLNYTVEFNGLFMATLDLDGKGSMAANGGAFDTRDAFTMSQMFLLANINPPLAGVSALQTNLKALASKSSGDTQTLLNNIIITPGSCFLGGSLFSFPTASPIPEPTLEPTTLMPTIALTDTGFSLAGGFAFLMSFSLFVFCYLQYCPGWVPGYRTVMGDGERKEKVDKSIHVDHKVELGRPVEFGDLAEPDIRFGKGHAVKRASLHFEGTQQSLYLAGDEPSGMQGPALMTMAMSAPRRLSSAPRRGSALSSPSMPEAPSTVTPFSAPETSIPSPYSSQSPTDEETGREGSTGEGSTTNPLIAEKRASGTKFSIKNLAAMKGRKSMTGGVTAPPIV